MGVFSRKSRGGSSTGGLLSRLPSLTLAGSAKPGSAALLSPRSIALRATVACGAVGGRQAQ